MKWSHTSKCGATSSNAVYYIIYVPESGVRGTSDCLVCRECVLFDDCACNMFNSCLISHFLQAVEYMSQLLPPGSIAQKKEECKKNKDIVKRGSCGRFLYFRDFSSESCICSVLKLSVHEV